MKANEQNQGRNKKPYSPPKLVVRGSVEKLTGWIGGPWGEFLGGEGSGFNPWKDPPAAIS